VMGGVNAVYLILVTSGALASANAVTVVTIVLGVDQSRMEQLCVAKRFQALYSEGACRR
jgi:hypothetical protein